MEPWKRQGARELETSAWTHTHTHTHTRRGKNDIASRVRGRQKAARWHFALPSGLLPLLHASAPRRSTPDTLRRSTRGAEGSSGRARGEGRIFSPLFLRVLFLFLGVVSLGEGAGDDGISELPFNLKSSIWIEWRVFR